MYEMSRQELEEYGLQEMDENCLKPDWSVLLVGDLCSAVDGDSMLILNI